MPTHYIIAAVTCVVHAVCVVAVTVNAFGWGPVTAINTLLALALSGAVTATGIAALALLSWRYRQPVAWKLIWSLTLGGTSVLALVLAGAVSAAV